MRVLNARQMREADRRTIDVLGIPSIVLMENAGRQVVAAMEAAFGSLAGRRVSVIAGRGNNGGDGFVVARGLWQQQCNAVVYLVSTSGEVRGDARINLDVLGRLGVPVVPVGSNAEWTRLRNSVLDSDVLVDALFGTGVSGPLSGLYGTVITDINAAAVPVVSIDLPSGLSADRSSPIGPAIAASLTVTLGAPKVPLVMPPADALAGALVVADIGIPRDVIGAVEGPRIEFMVPAEARMLVPVRAADAHKGTFGHVCVVAGSRGKSGAAHLAGMAALRSGAGLVTIATPRSCLPIVARMGAEYMTVGLSETADGSVTRHASKAVLGISCDVLAIGPGLGTGTGPRALVRDVLAQSPKPLVVDADALTVLAGDVRHLRARKGQVIVVTPHPGEMARLVGSTVADVQKNRIDIASGFARDRGVIVVLKGHRTVVAAPDGRVFVNSSGNPGMATGGSGDVLTGVVAGWLAQMTDPVEACRLAVYLHGAAGDMAAGTEGQVAMTAGDILSHLGQAAMALTDPAEASVGLR
ncbi:MAG: NAD(P)H-hydrate dehydratase [Acidobacteria bacterium]|nr:NAD(P)H-hydrate dehydratase [Acidobacteriota bacterium]